MAEPLEERRLLSVSLVSVNSGGTAPGGAASGAGAGGAFLQPAVSADGRYVAFTSDASDLVANGNDNNSARDVFVRDTQANTTALVSVAADNSGSGNGASGDVGTAGVSPTGGVGISADGRYVVFVSAASNLVANDNNNAPDVFVRDTQSGTTTLVTVDAAGGSATVPGGSAGSYDPVISDDGRYVAFVSTASNLSGADSGDGGAPDVFLRDLQVQPGAANAITLLTAAVSGGTGTAAAPTISNDGRFVAFLSDDQLVSGTAANGNDQVFVYDNSGGAQNGTITLASPDAAGTGAAGAAVTSPRISGDGRSVAFASDATNLVPTFTDANGTGKADVYVRDLDANTTTLVSASSAAQGGANTGGDGASYAPAISDDGNVVAFASDATDLVANVTDNNNGRDVFVRDLTAGTTSLASVSTTAGTAGDQPSGTAGGTGNGNTLAPALSGDGRFVVFSSTSTNLAEGATPTPTPTHTPTPTSNLYVRDTQSNQTTLLTPGVADPTNLTAGVGTVGHAAISRDGTTVAFVSDRNDLTSTRDTDTAADVFVATVAGATPTPTPTPTPTGTSGDLAVSLGGTLPMAVVSGGKAKVRPVVTVTNTGSDRVAGPVTVGLFFSTDQTLDAGDSAVTSVTRNLRLGGGKSRRVPVRVGALPAVPDGSYYLLSQITPGTTITDPNPANNVAASDQPITVAAPFTDLSGQLGPILASATRGKKSTITLDVMNGGNITAAGPISIAVLARPAGAADAATDTELKTFAVRLNVKPGATRRLRLRYTVPGTLPAGDYQVVAQIDSANQLPESDETNNTVVSTGTFTAV